MKVTFSFLFFILLGLTSCKNEIPIEKKEKQFTELQKAKWLLGRWENASADGVLSETWSKINDSTFLGKTYFIIKNDTVFSEAILLEERNKSLAYVVTVHNQNEGKPIDFKLTQNSNTKLVFENPTHDFPTKISYSQLDTDSLIAEISGIKNGVEKMEQFKMKKAR